MKSVVTALAALGVTTAVAFAQEVQDTDGNGTYSLEELQVVYPDLTDEGFGLIDANGDGAVDADELAAAQAAGTLGAN